MSKYEVFSGPYYPVFGLNTEIYGVNLCIQSEYTKIRTRKIYVLGHFLHKVRLVIVSLAVNIGRLQFLVSEDNFFCYVFNSIRRNFFNCVML